MPQSCAKFYKLQSIPGLLQHNEVSQNCCMFCCTILNCSVAHLFRLRVLSASQGLELQTQQADTALISVKLRARVITPKGSGEHQPFSHNLLSSDMVHLYVPYMLLCMSWHQHGPPIRVLTGVQACRSCCLCTIFKSLHQAKDVQTLQALLHFFCERFT